MSLQLAVMACMAFAAACQLASVITREYSWVDRLWSIAPVAYVAWFSASAGRPDARLVLMTALVVAWGARLTFNFARKGGYRRGGEDYRWKVLRERMSPAAFAVFNVMFINVFQHALLLLLALPAWIVARGPHRSLGPADAVAGTLFVLFLAGETVADQQQWNFHRNKSAPGFLRAGLFRYSRHPNFFCEQALWWSFYGFGVAAGATWWNISLLGPLLLTALFQGSTSFTETISASKYPEYAAYRRTTSRLIPWFPRSGR